MKNADMTNNQIKKLLYATLDDKCTSYHVEQNLKEKFPWFIPIFIPLEISRLVCHKTNNSNSTHSISSLILFIFPHNNVEQTNHNKIPISLIIPSLIHLCSPSNQIKTSIPRTFSAIFAKALFIYLFIFCALESLSVIESLLCFWTLEGTGLAYASAFDLKS